MPVDITKVVSAREAAPLQPGTHDAWGSLRQALDERITEALATAITAADVPGLLPSDLQSMVTPAANSAVAAALAGTATVRASFSFDTTANWTAANPVLNAHERAFDTDTKAARVGDGTTHYADLPIEQSSVYAPAGRRRRDLPPMTVWNPAANPDVPTITTLGPGGSSPITNGRAIAYNDQASVTLLGMVPVLVNQFGTNYWQNQANGSAGSGAPPYAVEFDYYGAGFAMEFRNAANNQSWFWVWVDGQPVTAKPQQSSAAAAGSLFWLPLIWSSAKQRRVRIYVAGADYGGLSVGPVDTVSATAHPKFKVFMLTDSWGAGTGADSPLSALTMTLGLMLGAEVYWGTFGGTGMSNPGGFVTFGDPLRIAPIAAVQPDWVIVQGSTNDLTYAAATVGAAATALYAAIKAAAPAAKLLVCDIQTLGSTPDSNTGPIDLAVTAAATAAGAMVIARPSVEQWITGSGSRTGTQETVASFTVGGNYAASTSLPAGTYYMVMTALTPGGETIATSEQSVTCNAGDAFNIAWNVPTSGPTPTLYYLYTGTMSGVYHERVSFTPDAHGGVGINSYTPGAVVTPPAVGVDTGAKGDGNADTFNNGAVPGHLTQAGHDYFARRLYADIAAALPA